MVYVRVVVYEISELKELNAGESVLIKNSLNHCDYCRIAKKYTVNVSKYTHSLQLCFPNTLLHCTHWLVKQLAPPQTLAIGESHL